MTDDAMVRPELISLEPDARQRVLQQVTAKGGHCESCGATDFDVGDALYLGFLFLDEDDDAYLVALTCRNPGLRAAPHGNQAARQGLFRSDRVLYFRPRCLRSKLTRRGVPLARRVVEHRAGECESLNQVGDRTEIRRTTTEIGVGRPRRAIQANCSAPTAAAARQGRCPI